MEPRSPSSHPLLLLFAELFLLCTFNPSSIPWIHAWSLMTFLDLLSLLKLEINEQKMLPPLERCASQAHKPPAAYSEIGETGDVCNTPRCLTAALCFPGRYEGKQRTASRQERCSTWWAKPASSTQRIGNNCPRTPNHSLILEKRLISDFGSGDEFYLAFPLCTSGIQVLAMYKFIK